MRRTFITSFAANLILGLYSFFTLPPRVAVHFGRGGIPDAWSSASTHVLLFFGIQVVLFIALLFSPSLLLKTPPEWTNIPHKGFWLKPENRERMQNIVSVLMWKFGTALFFFFFVLGVLSLKANLAEPVRLQEKPLFLALGIFLIYLVTWCIELARAFRIPDNQAPTGTMR